MSEVALQATYEGPIASEKDKIRFELGDTDMDRPMLYDEEIVAAMDLYTAPKLYSVLYRNMANKLILIGKRDLGVQKEDYTGIITYFLSQAEKYDRESITTVFKGASSRIVKPIFTKGMNDNI